MSTVNYIKSIQAYCSQHKLNLTANRSAVLAILHQHQGALSAYEILAKLQQQQANTKPPTVYRALDFLVQQHFVQHIESSSRYIINRQQQPFAPHPLLICTQCENVTQIGLSASLKAELEQFAAQQGFSLHSQSYEFQGLCSACQARTA
ncbi:Fur family transcriptional regulator [Agarivorans gilvus]|jgi:Fur family zinc uptake transcriptional regulator|uniref:Ferric uptake regulation protein n=1 Tax=Agarivorans gilvus TaxID=680279 RepID=A0ABQ1I6U9_9ALTE|nr:Fur family transcriptional regulator [Agarivorans gilvus]GGB15682.1 transcriptional regulator Zur [Agarivorans gilvus]